MQETEDFVQGFEDYGFGKRVLWGLEGGKS